MAQLLDFEFATSQRIIFGNGKVKVLPALVKELLGDVPARVLFVTGKNTEKAQALQKAIASAASEIIAIPTEPTAEMAVEGVNKGHAIQANIVIAIGGGSPIDCGKAIAMILTNGGEPMDYMEVIGRGKKVTKPSLPYIAIPTTSGTGAEVTRNAVLKSVEKAVKVSLRAITMLPTVALVDPELTVSLPAAITASTGLDALTQNIEPFVSNMANPITDALAREGIRLGGRSLVKTFRSGADLDARRDMALVSLYGGITLANAKLGAVHGFAGVIGGMFEAPHGMVCAALLPHVMRKNVEAISAREPNSGYLAKFDEVARLLTGNPHATALQGVEFIEGICRELAVPGLAHWGLTSSHVAEVVSKSAGASSMKGNPIVLTTAELTQILEQSM